MDIVENLSSNMTSFLKNNLPDKKEEDFEKMEYGIKVFLMNTYKIPALLLIAYFLGLFEPTLIASISLGFLKIFSAGIHARKWWSCLLTTFGVFFGIVLISEVIDFNIYLKVFLFTISMVSVILYAPADTEEKPYTSRKMRKILKILSIISTIIIFVLSIIVKNNIYSNIFILSIVTQSIVITPFVYKLMGRRYRNYEYYES